MLCPQGHDGDRKWRSYYSRAAYSLCCMGLVQESDPTRYWCKKHKRLPSQLSLFYSCSQLSKLSNDQLEIIKNKELLAFHQDTDIGTPAAPFKPTPSAPTTSTPEYFSGRSSKGTHVFVINTANKTATKTFDFVNIKGLARSRRGSFEVHDMWTGKDIGRFTGNYTFSLAAHDTAAFLVSPVLALCKNCPQVVQ